ncbi:hypothetical protein ACQQ4G_003141 [Listeria monocytogenes]
MTIESLKYIKEKLEANNINYEFMQFTDKVRYPYFVGEYTEAESSNEDGMQESTFILTGFTKGSWLGLEQAKEKIEKIFNHTVILPNGNGLAVFYSESLVIPTGDAELKKIQINLAIKEWKVNT